MSLVKYASFLSAITVSTAVVAEGSATNLDLLGSLGFAQNTVINSIYSKYNGYNLGASALFAVNDTAVGAPVVGGGVNFSHTTDKYDWSLIKLSLFGHAGFKFKIANEFAIFTLGNVGYSPLLLEKYVKNSVGHGYIKNFSYGASLIGMYKVMPEVSVGAGASYNFNYVKITDNKSDRFNELSANVYVAYSL
jgi:hypothetical protein